MQGYDLYGEVFSQELRTRFASPEFQSRVSLRDLLRGRVRKARSEGRVVALGGLEVAQVRLIGMGGSGAAPPPCPPTTLIITRRRNWSFEVFT